MAGERFRYPLWVRGDLDGFFGLMVDNLVQVLLIIALCTRVAHIPGELIYTRILPGVAISLLVGNLFYGVQAHWVARRQRNATCTALPYGINTPSVIAYVLFIMGPVYQRLSPQIGPDAAGRLAWQAGLLACLVSGVIEFTGAFYAERLRRVTPRAALLGVLAAVGITFIAAEFAFRIYTSPLVGLAPLAFLLLAYFAQLRFPLGLPGGFVAVLFGTAVAWLSTAAGLDWFGGTTMSWDELRGSYQPHWIQPEFTGMQLWTLLRESPDLLVSFLTISVPMGVINVLGSLQNIESAEAGGDRFATGPSLAVNGIGSIAAGLFGSCFPTTIYIGHPGWKALGARAGYSILNGVFLTALFLLGLGPFLRALIPIEAGAAIVVYIGVIITAQAFQATPREHAPAVAIALFPAMAALVVFGLVNYFFAAGDADALARLVLHPTEETKYLPGLITLTGANSGWILVTLFLAAIGAALIDHHYRAAAVWAAAATVLTVIGAMHAYRLEGNVIREYFLWQAAPYAHLQAAPPGPTTAPATATATAGGQLLAPDSAPAAAAAPQVAYRAYPVAVGYGVATLLFILAAARARRAAVLPAAGSAAGPPTRDRPWV